MNKETVQMVEQIATSLYESMEDLVAEAELGSKDVQAAATAALIKARQLLRAALAEIDEAGAKHRNRERTA